MIQDKIFFDEKDPTGLNYNTPFTVFGSYEGRLWSKAPNGSIKYYTQNSDLSAYATTGSNQFNGSQTITGSLTVTGGITGSVTTSSYVEYTNVANKPTLVSGSSQVSFNEIIDKPTLVSGSNQVSYSGLTNIPSGILSGSSQVSQFGYAITGSNGFNGSQSITGSLTVTGNIIAQTLNVQQVTSSVVFSSGSNIFGNSLSNTQQFTGSLQVSGSLHYLLGNVGIGISNPLGPLEVRVVNRLVSSDGILQVNTTNSQAIDLGGSLSFGGMYENGGTTPTEWAQLSGRKENSTPGVYSGYLQFATRPSGGVNTERMRISSIGNIGIGNDNPVYRLSVYASSANTQNIMAEFYNGDFTSATRNFVRVRNNINVGSTMSSYFGQGQDGKTYIISNDFTKNHIVIDGNSANIGIGTATPSVSLDISAKTDGIILPVGTTGQRPTEVNGLIRYNTNKQSLESYVSNNWVNVQTSANNGYGWRRPSTINIGGVLADGDRTWYSEINIANSYGSVVLNHVFTGNFTVVASWQRDFIGAGMVYKSGATLLDFNGFSADPTGPYFGGSSTSGFSVQTYASYNYLGLYPMPLGNGNTAGTKYFIKWQRSGNTLTMQYSTTGPYGAWSNFSSGTSATASSGDSVIVGAGEASGTENDPLRLLYIIQ